MGAGRRRGVARQRQQGQGHLHPLFVGSEVYFASAEAEARQSSFWRRGLLAPVISSFLSRRSSQGAPYFCRRRPATPDSSVHHCPGMIRQSYQATRMLYMIAKATYLRRSQLIPLMQLREERFQMHKTSLKLTFIRLRTLMKAWTSLQLVCSTWRNIYLSWLLLYRLVGKRNTRIILTVAFRLKLVSSHFFVFYFP